MSKLKHFLAVQFRHWRLSLFEKVILANCMMLIGEALAGLWITSHNIESHHYLIDMSFIVAATLLGLCINIVLLRASYGCGYDPTRHHEGLGIFGMRERALLLGGTIDFSVRLAPASWKNWGFTMSHI